MARNMAQSAAEMRAEELSPANQRLQALEEKIDEQQLEIDEANRRARDAESDSDAAVGMMLSR
jgi:predicted  nucleic acid-binding Zn-ribbon protein